tara:strand:- start:324 stop:566 length:243 start_codon:yes stop_codon:yes gene_type:complete
MDTGRDIYSRLSNAFCSENKTGQFILDIYTFGVATSKMAEVSIKFLYYNAIRDQGLRDHITGDYAGLRVVLFQKSLTKIF